MLQLLVIVLYSLYNDRGDFLNLAFPFAFLVVSRSTLVATKFGYGSLCDKRLTAILANFRHFNVTAHGVFLFGLFLSLDVSDCISMYPDVTSFRHRLKNLLLTTDLLLLATNKGRKNNLKARIRRDYNIKGNVITSRYKSS